MDGINRQTSGQGVEPGASRSNTPAPPDATHNSRTVREVPATSRFTRHPLVLKMELRQQVGERIINRLRDLARNNRLSTRSSPTTDLADDIDDYDLCNQAKFLSNHLQDLTQGDISDDQFTGRIQTLLGKKGSLAKDKQALEELLRRLSSEEFFQDDDQLLAANVMQPFYDDFKPRALSVFLNTTCGQYVLGKLQGGVLLDEDDRHKMLLGLIQIKAQLDARPASLSDVPLVEYANLFMGKDVSLDNPKDIQQIAFETLNKILPHRENALHQDHHLAEELTTALKSPLTAKRLPLASHETKLMRWQDPMYTLYRKIKAHPKLSEHLRDGELSLQDLKDSLQYLKKSVIRAEKDLAILNQQLEDCALLTEAQDEPAGRDLKKLGDILKTAARHSGNILERQTLTMLKDHADYQILEQTRKNFEGELYRQLSFLEKGGSEKTFTLSVNVGLALAAASVSGVSIGGKMQYTFKVTGNDDVKVREFHFLKPSLTVTAGDKKVVSASAEVGYDYGKGRVFRNLDDFVHFHSNDFIPMLLGSVGNLPGNAQGTINVRRVQDLHKNITADRHLLSQRLTQLGVLLPGDKVRVEQARPVNYADFHQHAIRGEATVNALAGLVEGTVAARNSATHFNTRTNLLFMLRNNPEKAIPPTRKYLSFWTPATPREQEYYLTLRENVSKDKSGTTSRLLNMFKEEDGVISRRRSHNDSLAWIATTQQLLEKLQIAESDPNISKDEAVLLRRERLSIRDQLKKAIVDQYIERDMYYFTVNAMEGHVGEEAPQEHFHTAKHSMQRVYNAKSRGEFIAAHIYSYYNLHHLYEKTFLPGETPVTNDAIFNQVLQRHIEPSLDIPQIHLNDDKHVRKSLTASSVAVSTEKTMAGELKVAIPGTDMSASADFKFSDIGKNVNPDNDGNYFTIGLNLQAGASPALTLKALEASMSKTRAKDSNFPEIALAELAPEILGATIKVGIRLEFHFVKRRKGWRMQYTRLSRSDGIGISSPDIGIPTGPIGEVKLGVSGKVSSVHNWWEQPGNNTLTYIYAKFNGWKAAKMIKTPSWELPIEAQTDEQLREQNPFAYYAQKHKIAISAMLANIGTLDKSVSHEFHEMLGQLDPEDPLYTPGFSDELTIMLKAHANNPDPDNMGPLIKRFERFLTLQHNVYLKEARSRYHPHFKKGRII